MSDTEEKLYTQAELDAAVEKAVKYVNECNARQLAIIETLRKRYEKAEVTDAAGE